MDVVASSESGGSSSRVTDIASEKATQGRQGVEKTLDRVVAAAAGGDLSRARKKTSARGRGGVPADAETCN
jgi:hypothetical protein